ncbi:hypothetical protein Tco_0229004, partial [Tanacetum coccineum]
REYAIKTDEEGYKFAEADFLNLNQNDIEDLYLLKIQNKIRNNKGAKEYDLIIALKMYIHRIVIKKRVEDVLLGFRRFTTYCCWFNIGAASEDLVMLRKIEENNLSL